MMDTNSNNSSSLNQSVMLSIIVRAIGRIIISVLIATFGFYLAFMSTVGPTIAPEVWDGDLDMLIRLSVLGLGFLTMIGAVVWLIFPVAKRVFAMLNKSL
ncbi:hypothetical protein [Psychrobacter sp. I-STPA6b]|uniref:hypothetical protein n=1 Tax=Psychrobacter sp. I-STPA6b TaxID=2585718 RepID=UPI001D0BFF37|nr:hypothetical protein [Psychrobacter sp. I-STPA6b]